MPVEVELNTPLAEALNAAIQPKLVEVGWGTGGGDDTALAEYIILMLVNGKTQDQIAAELSGELLGLPPDDPGAHEFAKWLFAQIDLLSQQQGNGAQPANGQEVAEAGDMDTDMGAVDASELNAPTGPRSMRNGNHRGGREKRLMGHISKAMDRTPDSALHRVRGGGGINAHGRGPPTGPRGGARMRGNNNRAANIQHGLAAGMGNGPPFPGMPGPHPNGQMDVYAILEQQNQMMFQLSQQIMIQNNGGHQNQNRRGKSLFDRVQDPHNKHNNQRRPRPEGANQEAEGQGEDVEMGGKREPPNPEENVCKYNLNCTNRECKFAHQSPAAPVGAPVDVNDPCSFGAACKNRKCVARHPSPAARLAHQSEQDCKFFPNCQNPRCPFKHPSMPLCRNGADCTTPNCKFTHVKTKCKFNPCLNPTCAFAHEEGQQGGFKDKVWTAESEEHVSDRKFVDDEAGTEMVKPEDEMTRSEEMAQDAEAIG